MAQYGKPFNFARWICGRVFELPAPLGSGREEVWLEDGGHSRRTGQAPDGVVINTPKNVKRMAALIRAAGVKPELEIFDSGDMHLARDLIAEGVLEGPGLWTFVTGVKYGFCASPETLLYARNLLPCGATWAAFGVGRFEFPMVAQSWLAGGNVRVGLEDNIYISKGVLAQSNAALVERARDIVCSLGGELATANEARELLGLNR